MKRRVIFVDPDIWTHKEDHSTEPPTRTPGGGRFTRFANTQVGSPMKVRVPPPDYACTDNDG